MRAGRVLGAASTCVLGLALFAAPVVSVPQTHFLLQSSAEPQKGSTPNNRGGDRSSHPSSRKMGDWLREHRNLPLDQQEKLLESDPNFKKLPRDRQAALKERLRKFASLPPERQDRALQRMQFMSSLTAEQRKEIREANQQLQSLPPERRVMIHAAVRHLRRMDPQQRQQTIDSESFRSTFSPQEQNILKQLASIGDATPKSLPSPAPALPK